jgi:hypothetical protein
VQIKISLFVSESSDCFGIQYPIQVAIRKPSIHISWQVFHLILIIANLRKTVVALENLKTVHSFWG